MNQKTKKQMIAVVLVGILLIVADLAASLADGNAELIKENGKVYLVRPEEGESSSHITFRATLRAGGETFDKDVSMTVAPYSQRSDEQEESIPSMTEREQAEYEFRTLTGSINSDLTSQRIELPSSLHSGATITWQREHTNNSVLLGFLTMLAGFFVYRSGFQEEKKRRERQTSSVMRQLPEFVNRLVLLLNAGLVLSTAFERSVEEGGYQNESEGDYFYANMKKIYDSVKYANGSVNGELRRFAKESGMKEVIRISNIISDNIHKGTELNEKLESESQILWLTRKKNCEERGRLAETKLTLPLVMFLMVLIVITVAPALIEL